MNETESSPKGDLYTVRVSAEARETLGKITLILREKGFSALPASAQRYLGTKSPSIARLVEMGIKLLLDETLKNLWVRQDDSPPPPQEDPMPGYYPYVGSDGKTYWAMKDPEWAAAGANKSINVPVPPTFASTMSTEEEQAVISLAAELRGKAGLLASLLIAEMVAGFTEPKDTSPCLKTAINWARGYASDEDLDRASHALHGIIQARLTCGDAALLGALGVVLHAVTRRLDPSFGIVLRIATDSVLAKDSSDWPESSPEFLLERKARISKMCAALAILLGDGTPEDLELDRLLSRWDAASTAARKVFWKPVAAEQEEEGNDDHK